MLRISKEEMQVRRELTDCYHLAARFGWTDLIYTHISARVPGEIDTLLINPFGYLYEQITPENLVKVDYSSQMLKVTDNSVINFTGYVIHAAIHRARPEVACVMHTHTTAGMALSALECGLLPITQHGCRFYNRIGYHDFQGIVVDVNEQPALVNDLGSHKAMILKNHGLLTVGRTIPEAFSIMHFLERAAQAQMMALSAGQKLNFPPPEVCERTARQFGDEVRISGQLEWNALIKLMRMEQKEKS